LRLYSPTEAARQLVPVLHEELPEEVAKLVCWLACVKAMKAGAIDFITKPVNDQELVLTYCDFGPLRPTLDLLAFNIRL